MSETDLTVAESKATYEDRKQLMKRELKMKEIIDFIEENVNGRTLFTKELVYKLEDGALV